MCMRAELAGTVSVGILNVLGVMGVLAWILLTVFGDFEQVASQPQLVYRPGHSRRCPLAWQ